jgi:hypothetical protein
LLLGENAICFEGWVNTSICFAKAGNNVRRNMRGNLLIVVLYLGLGGCAATEEWLGRVGQTGAIGLTQQEIVAGLRAALDKGVDHAVMNLGREGGFLRNVEVRIPIPESLQPAERTLRALGQGALVDEFEATMNRAAERAVPEAAEVLVNSIRQMTFADAENILRGHETAATDYFRRTSETNLHRRFLPIVKEATERTGVTAAYKRMRQHVAVGIISEAVLGREAVDIDAYVTQRALDGLFLKIAEQEELIRENPAQRTSEILRRVFGAIVRGPGAVERNQKG